MTFEQIYNIFKIKTDGEEFDSDDDALFMADIARTKILALRDWIILKTTTSISITSDEYDYSAIDNLDKPLKLWDDDYELKKATFENRKNTDYDYWIDYANKKIKFINEFTGKTLDLDYKYKPATLEEDDDVEDLLGQCMAHQMIIDFYEKDQDNTFYKEAVFNLEKTLSLLTNYNENLRF